MNHFIVNLFLVAPYEAAGRALYARHHVWFLDGFRRGILLFFGARVTGEGSVALARAPSREFLVEFLELDPLVEKNLAAYNLVEFIPENYIEALGEWLNSENGQER